MILVLIQNITLIISLVLLYQYILRRFREKNLTASILSGSLFGIVAVVAMVAPFKFAPGIIYDGRSIVLSVGGLFGGPVAAFIAAAIASGFRIALGGNGVVPGVITIVESTFWGILGYELRKKGKLRLTVPALLATGFVVHLSMLAAQLTIPSGRWHEVLPGIALPILIVYPLGFLLICQIFLDAEERAKRASELAESEYRYRLLFEESMSIKLIVDPATGAIVDANKKAAEFYGWTKEELFSMKVSEINTLPDDVLVKKLAEAKKGDTNVFHFRHRLKSGEIRDVEIFSSPIEYYGNPRLYFIIHDITERVKAEEMVAELNKTLEVRVRSRTAALEDANSELESFAYSVSHDLRTPLRAIDSFAALLSEELPADTGAEARHHLERVRVNAARMQSIIENLLRLSKIDRQRLEFSKFDLSALAKEICDELSAPLSDRKLDVEIEGGLTVNADRGLMRILLENLFANAVKYTSSQPDARISFGSETVSGETAFRVTDNGVGFDMAYADRLFTPFQRLHSDPKFTGEGIGLSIARRIVVRHGGHIWASGETGKGAAFYFTLGTSHGTQTP